MSTTRLLNHFSDETTWVVISTYRTERTEDENRSLLKKLKQEVRKLNLGFTEFISRWVEVDKEICTTPFIDYDGNEFNTDDVVRTFNLGSKTPFNLEDAKEIFARRKGGPASMPIKSNRAFKLNEMYEVESDKPTTFSGKERWIPIFN